MPQAFPLTSLLGLSKYDHYGLVRSSPTSERVCFQAELVKEEMGCFLRCWVSALENFCEDMRWGLGAGLFEQWIGCWLLLMCLSGSLWKPLQDLSLASFQLYTSRGAGTACMAMSMNKHELGLALNLILWPSSFSYTSALTVSPGDKCYSPFIVVLVQSLSNVQLFATPWTAARQASLSFTISQSLLKLMSIESMMPSNHLILCRPLFLLPSIFPSIRVFSNELALCIRWPKYWSFSFSISPSSEYSGLVSFRIVLFDLLADHGTLKSLLQHQSLQIRKLRFKKTERFAQYPTKDKQFKPRFPNF